MREIAHNCSQWTTRRMIVDCSKNPSAGREGRWPKDEFRFSVVPANPRLAAACPPIGLHRLIDGIVLQCIAHCRIHEASRKGSNLHRKAGRRLVLNSTRSHTHSDKEQCRTKGPPPPLLLSLPMKETKDIVFIDIQEVLFKTSFFLAWAHTGLNVVAIRQKGRISFLLLKNYKNYHM